MRADRSSGQFRRDLLPSPETYYEHALGVARTAPISDAGWLTTRCCFHPDRHPSLSINMRTGGYCCHVPQCGARGGNVLDFHMQRHGLDFVTAARELGAWV